MSLSSRVESLLERKGAPLEIVRTTGSTFDPVTGKKTGGSPETLSAFGVVTKDQDKFSNALRGVGDQDVVLIMDTKVQPELGDKLTFGEQVYSVKEFSIQYYENVPVYYTVRIAV